MRDRELATWQELAALVAGEQLEGVGYSYSTGRAYVEHDGVLVWAHVGDATLSPHVAGAGVLQGARLRAFGAMLEQQRADELAAMTPEQRERRLEHERKVATMPDPPEWMMERELERRGLV